MTGASNATEAARMLRLAADAIDARAQSTKEMPRALIGSRAAGFRG